MRQLPNTEYVGEVGLDFSRHSKDTKAAQLRVFDRLRVRDAARRLVDGGSEAGTLNNLGVALREVRRFEEAITAHQDAAAIYRETGDRHREGEALNNLGLALVGVRRFEEAIAVHEDSVAMYRETGDRHASVLRTSDSRTAPIWVGGSHFGRAFFSDWNGLPDDQELKGGQSSCGSRTAAVVAEWRVGG